MENGCKKHLINEQKKNIKWEEPKSLVRAHLLI